MSRWLAFMWALIGAFCGQLLGSALQGQVPLLNQSLPLGFGPADLDLVFLAISFGVRINLSVGGAIGLVLALWLALRNG